MYILFLFFDDYNKENNININNKFEDCNNINDNNNNNYNIEFNQNNNNININIEDFNEWKNKEEIILLFQIIQIISIIFIMKN